MKTDGLFVYNVLTFKILFHIQILKTTEILEHHSDSDENEPQKRSVFCSVLSGKYWDELMMLSWKYSVASGTKLPGGM